MLAKAHVCSAFWVPCTTLCVCVCVTSKMAACTIKELKTQPRLEKRQNETGKVYLNPLNSFILCVCVYKYKHKGVGRDGPARFRGVNIDDFVI
jgi:hypothetical protein